MRPEERPEVGPPDPTNDPTKAELEITGDDEHSVIIIYRHYPGNRRVCESRSTFTNKMGANRMIEEHRKVGSSVCDRRKPRPK